MKKPYMGQSIREWAEYTLWKAAFKKLKQYGLLQADHTLASFLKAAFHNFYLVHSWILSPIYIGQFSSNNFENLRIRKWNDFRYLVHKSLMPVYFGDNKFINF